MAENTVDSYIPFFGRDFLTATMGWSAEERGHYIVLLITQWEQGSIPASPERLPLISPGVDGCWATLEPKFPIDADGLRRNPRLEAHRARATQLKQARSAAGAKGNETRWGSRDGIAKGSQRDRTATDLRVANSIAKPSPPSPSPSPIDKEEKTNTGTFTFPSFPCDKGQWVPTAEMVEEWKTTYPALDVVAQLRRARQWCIDNPERRKTPKGMRRFIGTWMGNAQAAPKPATVSTKVLATL
jgi:hypothetical protein